MLVSYGVSQQSAPGHKGVMNHCDVCTYKLIGLTLNCIC